MLPWVCSVIDHRRRQNVVRTSVTHSAIASCATFLFLSHFDVICDLLLNRRTATWNLFVKFHSLPVQAGWYTNAVSESRQSVEPLEVHPATKNPPGYINNETRYFVRTKTMNCRRVSHNNPYNHLIVVSRCKRGWGGRTHPPNMGLFRW